MENIHRKDRDFLVIFHNSRILHFYFFFLVFVGPGAALCQSIRQQACQRQVCRSAEGPRVQQVWLHEVYQEGLGVVCWTLDILYTHTHAHTHTHIYIYTYIHIHSDTHTYIYICIYVYMYMYIYIYIIYIHVCVCARIHFVDRDAIGCY